MKKLLLALALIAGYFLVQPNGLSFMPAMPVASPQQSEQDIAAAFASRQSNLQVQGSGTVTKLLPDDTNGSRHQRFIVRLNHGQTVLVAHNIDLAPRVDALREGDTIAFYGEYEWNEKGGVIHWTHHDPASRHADGWLKHQDKTYR